MTQARPGRLTIGSAVVLLALSACGSTVSQSRSGTESNPLTVGDGGLGERPTAAGTTTQQAVGQLPAGGLTSTTQNGSGGTGGGSANGGSNLPGDGQVAPSRAQVTTPIEIGLLVGPSSASAQSALGSNKSAASGFGTDATFKALVQYYNSHGGLGGRKIVPITYTANATDASYDNDAQAACATFTQDHHVAAVITTSGDFWSDNYASCLSRAHIPNLALSFATTDDVGFKSYPTTFATTAISVDERLMVVVQEMIKTQHLRRGDQLGVIVEGCPFNVRAYTNTLVPLAKREGLSLNRRDINCVTGYSDAGTAIGQIQASVLPFETANVQKILPIAGYETSVVDYFEKQAQSQGYAPTYFVSSTSQMASQQSNFTASALRRIFGTGWMPTTDVAVYAPDATTRECRKILASYGIVAQNRADQYLVDGSCDPFRYLDAALRSTNGAADVGSLKTAIEGLGGRVPSSAMLGGTNGLSPRQHFAAVNVDAFSYVPNCTCFQYQHHPLQLS